MKKDTKRAIISTDRLIIYNFYILILLFTPSV